jgi:hypothetical protein
MELNKIERLVENTLTVKLVSKRERVTKVLASTDVASHLMQYKSILSIYLMRLRSPTRTLQRCKAAV